MIWQLYVAIACIIQILQLPSACRLPAGIQPSGEESVSYPTDQQAADAVYHGYKPMAVISFGSSQILHPYNLPQLRMKHGIIIFEGEVAKCVFTQVLNHTAAQNLLTDTLFGRYHYGAFDVQHDPLLFHVMVGIMFGYTGEEVGGFINRQRRMVLRAFGGAHKTPMVGTSPSEFFKYYSWYSTYTSTRLQHIGAALKRLRMSCSPKHTTMLDVYIQDITCPLVTSASSSTARAVCDIRSSAVVA